MTRRRRRILLALAVAGAAVAAIGIGAARLLPRWAHATAERLASRALGRSLTIGRPLEVSLSVSPRVVAGDVRLANAPWGSEPSMLRVGRLAVVVDLPSLWRGPARVRELVVEEARLLLEADGAGRANWDLGPATAPARPPGPREEPPVLIDRAAIRGLELTYRPRPGAAPVAVGVRELEARLDPATRMVELRGAGRFGEAPWELSGRLGTLERLLEGRDVDLALVARLGAASLEARGRIGEPLALGAPDLELSAEGPDLVAALEPLGLRSPATGPFRLRARLTPAGSGVGAAVDAAVGAVTARAQGELRSPRSLEAFRVAVEARGPDASAVGSWAGVRGLPPSPFELSGRVRREGGRIHLEAVRARVGPTSLEATGVLGEPPRLVGTDLAVRGRGKDLAALSRPTGLRLPRGPFQVEGRLLLRTDGLAVEAAELRWRGAAIRAGGRLGEPPGLPGLDLRVDAAGPDLSAFSGLATVRLPRRPFALRGRVAREGRALRLEEVEVRLGEVAASGGGRLVPARRLEGSDLRGRVAGPDLAELASLAGLRGAPAQPFEARGGVRVVPGALELEAAEGSVGRLSFAAEGRVGAASGLEGTSLSCRAAGPALSDLAAWGLPVGLPADPFSVAGRLRVEEGALRVEEVVASVGPDGARVDGVLGALPDPSRLDLSVEVSGPSLAGLGRLLPAAGRAPPAWLPPVAYQASGRVRRVPSGVELRGVRARVGEAEARLEGTVGSGKGLAGTELRVEASGPDLAAALGPLAGSTRLPAVPFELSADLAGGVERLAARHLTARVGGSDLAGSLSLRLEGKPAVEAALRSRRLDVAELLAGLGAAEAPPATPDSPPRRAPGQRLLSDRPLELGALRSVDATLRLEVGELPLPGLPLREVAVAAELRDGALRLDRAEAVGLHGGRVSVAVEIEPAGDGHRVATRGRIEGLRLVAVAASASSGRAPAVDVEFQLQGAGRTPHELAATLEGAALAVLGPGEVTNAYERVASGALRALLDALNPFRTTSDHTDFECGVVAATATGGRAAVEPIAGRTREVAVVGSGHVDLATEAIDFIWAIKPRRGVGLSAASIANPYVRLGGSLSAPRLELKPLEAAASTGAAIATMGITLLAKGVYDRITAEQKVCVDALAKARGDPARMR